MFKVHIQNCRTCSNLFCIDKKNQKYYCSYQKRYVDPDLFCPMHNPTKVDEETRLKTYECINKEIAKKIEQEKQELVTKVECLTQIQYCLDKRLEDDKDWMIGDKKVKKVWTSSQYVNILASKDNKDYLLKIEIHPWEEDKSN